MIPVVFPKPDFKMKNEQGKEYIFDSIRKSWILLTPEEWVRQNFIQYLTETMNYPSALIALEKEIWIGDVKKRFDILVYNKEHRPWMLVECKSTSIKLTENVLSQVLRYNISVPVQFLVITNGHYTYGWERREGGVREIISLPSYEL